MTIVLGLADLRSSHMSTRFEGRRHGDVDLSFFLTDAPPGSGPRLHKHPYSEVFIVQEGEATFTAGDEELVVTGDQVVVVPPETRTGSRTPARASSAKSASTTAVRCRRPGYG